MKRILILISSIMFCVSCQTVPKLPTQIIKKNNLKKTKYLAFPAPCKKHGIHWVHIYYQEETHRIKGYLGQIKHAHILYIKLEGCPAGDRIIEFTPKLANLFLPLYIGKSHKHRIKAGMLIYVKKEAR